MAKSKKSVMWQKTLAITFIVVVLGFGFAIAYLVRWQIIDGEDLKSAALDQSLVSTTLSATRGTIYDATGTKILAQTASVWTVVLEPNYVESEEDKVKISNGLSEILGIDYDTIYKKLEQNSYYTYLKRKVETSVKDQILAFKDENNIGSGIRLIEDYKRYYPYGTTASVVLGFTGTDNTGLAGLELEYEKELSGTAGRMVSAKNALGTDMPFQYEQLISAEDGYSLVLTIDETVQSIVEKYLDEGCEKYSVKNGAAAVMMNVNTGAIVALAVSGDFDPNDPFTLSDSSVQAEIDKLPEDEQDAAYSNALQKQWRNKAVSDTYVPGSVFKMVTASMALDSGAITKDTTFNCDGSYVPYPGVDPINCWVSPSAHGSETVREGICNSCNPFFMQAGKAMGSSLFYKYFKAFGLTETTGIDLPGESSGISYDEDHLLPVELATESFGQNFTITPIQMITAASAVANGGYIVQPHVVDKIIDSDGNIVESKSTEYKRQVISSDVSALVTNILEQNVSSPTATGRNGYVSGYSVCGKTGTSEKVAEWRAELASGNENALMQYIASFCGYAPADNPEYALLVFLDEPDRDTASGGGMAAPLFSKIMGEVLPYLGIEKQATDEGFDETQTTAPSLVGKTISEAKALLEENGFEFDVYNSDAQDDDAVVMQIPAANSPMPIGGKVVLYTSEDVAEKSLCTVPDFQGKSQEDCNYLATQAGIQMVMTGTSSTGNLVAQSQDIAAGEKVKPGTVVTITFIDSGASERT